MVGIGIYVVLEYEGTSIDYDNIRVYIPVLCVLVAPFSKNANNQVGSIYGFSLCHYIYLFFGFTYIGQSSSSINYTTVTIGLCRVLATHHENLYHFTTIRSNETNASSDSVFRFL